MKTRTTPIVLSMLLVGSVVVASGCERRDMGERPPQQTETTGAQTKVEQVKDDPARFFGKRITLSGEVDDIEGAGRSFKLEGGDWLFTDEIRVLAKTPVKMGGVPLSDDDHVVVSGTVRRFVVAEVERELGWDLSSELEITLKDKPVVVADEIRRIEPAATWSAANPEGEIVGTVLLVTVSPDVLAGQRIRLDRAKIQNVAGKGIWVGESHSDQTFVLPSGGSEVESLKAGDLVDVRGVVKKTPRPDQAIKDWSLPSTMRSVIEGEPLYIEAATIERASSTPPKAKTKKK